jgi:hypothetical protein
VLLFIILQYDFASGAKKYGSTAFLLLYDRTSRRKIHVWVSESRGIKHLKT